MRRIVNETVESLVTEVGIDIQKKKYDIRHQLDIHKEFYSSDLQLSQLDGKIDRLFGKLIKSADKAGIELEVFQFLLNKYFSKTKKY